MTDNDLNALFLGGFAEPFGVVRDGESLRVSLPIFLADGDGVEVFVERHGRGILVTDLGSTWMRLSYRRDHIGDHERERLMSLATPHGIELAHGVLSSEVVAPESLTKVALALAQVQVMADAVIESTARRAKGHEVVRRDIADALVRHLRGRVHVEYVVREEDPDGIFPLDIFIDGEHPTVVAVATDEGSAERAVATRLAHKRLDASWLYLSRSQKLRAATKRRLDSAYQPVVSDFEEEMGLLQERIVSVANGHPILPHVKPSQPNLPGHFTGISCGLG